MRRSVLFVDQGRDTPSSALGHVRVRDALETAATALDLGPRFRFREVPRSTRGQRMFFTRVPKVGSWHFGSVRWHLARSWAARRLIIDEVRRTPTDAVHVTTDQVGLLLGPVQKQVPCVMSLDMLALDWACLKRGFDATTGGGVPAYLRPIARLERRALARSPLTIAWTETVARRVRSFAPEASVVALHPGLDTTKFHPAPPQTSEGPLRVLFVGGRWEAKGGPELVEALGADLGHGVRLDVVTTLDLPPREGMHVHRATPGSPKLLSLFASADVFCLPTHVDACPWVVLEAMASGLPVVTTNVGSIPELIGELDGAAGGVSVNPGDVSSLGRELRRVLGDAALRAAWGAAGRARVESHYDAVSNTAKLMTLLQSARRGGR